MRSLADIKDTSRPKSSYKRVGRGPGSGKGKTSGRGEKGAGARSGYKRRHGYEGGQFRTFMKLPIRGFSNARFRKDFDAINLEQIDAHFENGETVNKDTLIDKGLIHASSYGVKILGKGELTKKVTIEADAASEGALEKLKAAKIAITLPQ